VEKFYSRVEPGLLLHQIHRLTEVDERESQRVDLVDADNFIQCSSLKMAKGVTFRPHKHLKKTRTFSNHKAQESWICIRGVVQCIFYDIDDTVLAEPLIYPGDASFTLHGGHNYMALSEDTIVYEYKTGPYEGQAIDKEFVDD
jgi:hypothetical protein